MSQIGHKRKVCTITVLTCMTHMTYMTDLGFEIWNFTVGIF